MSAREIIDAARRAGVSAALCKRADMAASDIEADICYHDMGDGRWYDVTSLEDQESILSRAESVASKILAEGRLS